jgi:hypothetical protein
LASAIARRVNVEPEILEAGAALDQPDLGVVKCVDVAELGAKLVERTLQGRVLFGLEPALAELGGGKSDRGAEHHGAGYKHGQEGRQARRRRLGIAVAGGWMGRLV